MDPLQALDRYGSEGPPLRRWEAVVLSDLRHGESHVSGAVWMVSSCVVAGVALVAAVLGTLEFFGAGQGARPATWTSLVPWLVVIPTTLLAGIEYRWWRWLAGRKGGRHKR